MSGWRLGVYQLTQSKATWWHRYRVAGGGCSCMNAAEMVEAHLDPAGFVTESHGSWWSVTEGPGMAELSAQFVYEALSGSSFVGTWREF